MATTNIELISLLSDKIVYSAKTTSAERVAMNSAIRFLKNKNGKKAALPFINEWVESVKETIADEETTKIVKYVEFCDSIE